MGKQKASEDIRTQIKLERLRKHLEEVEEISMKWASQLTYQSILPPVLFLEGKPLYNHMLRKHLRKRALWKNYTEWEQRIRRIRELSETLFKKAQEEGLSRSDASPVVNAAFKERYFFFTPVFGSSDKEIIKANKSIVEGLVSLEEMAELGKEWDSMRALGEKMHELVFKAIRSSDILYPCQLCKQLWEDD